MLWCQEKVDEYFIYFTDTVINTLIRNCFWSSSNDYYLISLYSHLKVQILKIICTCTDISIEFSVILSDYVNKIIDTILFFVLLFLLQWTIYWSEKWRKQGSFKNLQGFIASYSLDEWLLEFKEYHPEKHMEAIFFVSCPRFKDDNTDLLVCIHILYRWWCLRNTWSFINIQIVNKHPVWQDKLVFFIW